jgi:hypothetical protein
MPLTQRAVSLAEPGYVTFAAPPPFGRSIQSAIDQAITLQALSLHMRSVMLVFGSSAGEDGMDKSDVFVLEEIASAAWIRAE